VASTLGSLQISLSLSFALLGACSLQCHYYYQHYKDDKRILKGIVAIIWFMELVHAIIMLHAVYVLDIKGFGDRSFLHNPPWSLKMLIPLSAALDIIVEICFTYRVRALSRHWLTAIIAWLLIAVRLVFVIVATFISFHHGLDKLVTKYNYIVDVAISALALTDLVIAISMFYYLNRIRSGFPSSEQVINRLGVFAFECGLVNVCLGVSILAAVTRMPTNYIWLALVCIHSKVYSNALLLSLNRREAMAQVFQSTVSEMNRPSKLLRLATPKRPFTSNIKSRAINRESVVDIYIQKREGQDIEISTNASNPIDA